MDDLIQLAELIRTRNAVMKQIAHIIQRPALIGHVGEFIAAHIFGIALEESASQKGLDGRFTHGQLAGRSVNIKWYPKRENILDVRPDALPDFYLVLAGPKSTVSSSRGGERPWVIENVYLFDAPQLVRRLRSRGVKIGVATSVRQQLWEEAEVYPTARNKRLILTDAQRKLLAHFRGKHDLR
jgi:hypothetical protein